MKTPLALALFALLPLSAKADEPFRCGQRIVTSDLTVDQLTERCGLPTSHQSKTEDVLVRNRNNGLMIKVGETTTETWVYERGPQALTMVVTIVDGKIKSIDQQH
jgi:Protein of unknown function (DUF2845)